MIRMEPRRRADGEEIVKVANEEIAKLKNSNKIDKTFIMEDIYFKINLLDYEVYFCKQLNILSISRWEFVDEEEDFTKRDKFIVFVKLATWLSKIITSSKTCQPVKASPKDVDEKEDKQILVKNLMNTLKNTNVKFT